MYVPEPPRHVVRARGDVPPRRVPVNNTQALAMSLEHREALAAVFARRVRRRPNARGAVCRGGSEEPWRVWRTVSLSVVVCRGCPRRMSRSVHARRRGRVSTWYRFTPEDFRIGALDAARNHAIPSANLRGRLKPQS